MVEKRYYDRRYVAGTTIGKPLYIKREPKMAQGTNHVEYVYSLTDNIVECTKCTNKFTAETLIEFYVDATKSTKTFEPKVLNVTYSLEEEYAE